MEIDLEDRFFSIEISFCFSIFNSKSEICISKFKSRFTNRKHPEPWNALLTSREEGARKGALKIVRLITPLLAYRGWRGSPTAVDSWKLGSPCSWPSHLAQCSIILCSFSRKKADSAVQKTKEPFARCEQHLQPVQYQPLPVQHVEASSSQGQASQGIFLRTDLDFSVSIFEVSWSLSNMTDEQLPLIKIKRFLKLVMEFPFSLYL